MAAKRAAEARRKLHARALELPGAYEDHPWGETVVKVGKKIFVFLGVDNPAQPAGFGLKLPDSHEAALAVPGASPMGYGLGKAGWVSFRLSGQGKLPPLGVLLDWLEESYRAVAPKKLVRQLDDLRESRTR
jgi:predicted DNA-binding protein (MmcQ/YjbR family)